MVYRRSYMRAHVLFNLLNELGKRENARLAKHFIVFHEFNKFNNTGARMLDSIYHMTIKSHFWRENFDFAIFYAEL